MNKTLIIGHRGAKGRATENTLSSFQKAIDLKVDGIELDVHLTADGAIVVFHDETLDRMTNGNGKISDFSLAELKTFRVAKEHLIPTLKEVFDLVNKRCFINIELKGEGTAKPVVDLIEEYIANKGWDYSHFQVSSFNWNMLIEVSELNSEIFIGVLTEIDLDAALAFAKAIKAKAINPYFRLLTSKNTEQLQDEGFQVFPWTVNKPTSIKKIKSFKTDGIITDYPDRI